MISPAITSEYSKYIVIPKALLPSFSEKAASHIIIKQSVALKEIKLWISMDVIFVSSMDTI